MSPSNILLLCDEAARHTGTVDEHIRALKQVSRSRVTVVDSRAAARLDLDLAPFDAVVFHYSIVISMAAFLPAPFFAKLAGFTGPKILFIQDEYRWVDRTAKAIRDLGISTIFTVVNAEVVRKIYREPWFDQVRFEETLTGYVPESLLTRTVPDYAERRIDVSYRARELSGWLGAFGQEKWQIGAKFRADAKAHGLTTDIAMSEDSRIYGEAWINFVSNSKAVLGTESGASFIDFSGEIQNQVESFEKQNPAASFEDVQRRFLDGDGAIVIHVISPRCFEAAALRTLMILYPGSYSGALEAGRHFVPLARDHSNMAEVVAVLRDPARAGEIIGRAYEEVACSPAWTFRTFVEKFDRVVDEEVARHWASSTIQRPAMTAAEVQRQAAQFNEIEAKSRNIAASRIAAIAFAHRLQRLWRNFDDTVRAVLPARGADALIGAVRALAEGVKPLIKRMLLGRTK